MAVSVKTSRIRFAKMNANRPVLLSALLASFVPFLAFGQASFRPSNYDPPALNAPVFDAQGTPLAGSDYLAEVWGGAESNSLTPLVLIDRGNAREIVPFTTGGYFIPTSTSDRLCVLDVPPSGWAWLQVRAWEAALGSTYEQAAGLGMGGYGESALFYGQGRDPFREPPEPSALLIGLESFSLRPVPEPSVWALLALVGSAVWWAVLRRPDRGT